jgi:hypothetical protein
MGLILNVSIKMLQKKIELVFLCVVAIGPLNLTINKFIVWFLHIFAVTLQMKLNRFLSSPLSFSSNAIYEF